MLGKKGMRAPLVILAISVGVTGCSSLSQGSLDTLRAAIMGASLSVDESTLDPTAGYLLLSADDGELMMGRGADSDEGLEAWYGAGDELLSLRNGIIVNSLGMARNLVDVRWQGPLPWLRDLEATRLPVTYSRQIDRLPAHFNEVTEYLLKDEGEHKVSVWGQSLRLRRLQEHVVASNSASPMPGNTYWLAADGRLLLSRQWLAPDHEVFIQLRPQSPAATPAPVTPPVPVADGAASHLIVAVEPIRLGELLARYPLPQAWAPGSAWLVRGEELPQAQRKRGVLFDIDKALEGQVLPSVTGERLRRFRARLVDMPVTGRKPLPALNARWLQVNPKRDPLFNGSDRLLRVLRAPTQITVTGDVAQDCQLPVTPDLTVRQAVAGCTGARFLPDTVYLITPQGQVSRHDIALWNREPDLGVMPGGLIFVPFTGFARASGNAAADADLAAWLATQTGVMP